ncbi:hypothetical protein GCM10010277_55900 [Streptomyces longisporoflavus]|uniref:hypothetical protein n=1 Tax=Streptomyces longisporoflavus TaxID=28044 RepID=UPI00167EB8D1|nr:hypothetical protein [Streptomyces longisporoflavus]GGV55464.1 hypothetical protein GCM10010277_55900 [Streptomyces longisporoflavus]
MAMVGLFWIAEGDVYVGAKPSGLAAGVRLTPEGVVGLGDKQSTFYPWDEVRALTVEDAPVKSLKRQVGALVDAAMTAGLGGLYEAPAMTVRITRAEAEETELTAYVAAATGYSRSEHDLSLALLARMTEGEATLRTTLATMAEWGRRHEGGSPGAAKREELLRRWTEGEG